MEQPDTTPGMPPMGGFPPATNVPVSDPIPIPEHTLLRCIGHGSYGQVWLARNAFGVYRAVKIVHRKSFPNQRPFERELAGIRRFEPVSRLHDGFIDVLQVGINEGGDCFYYIMEIGDDQVAGQIINPDEYHPKTLASEIVRRGRIPLAECLKLGVGLCQALAELHGRDLVHRDVKPANIIFVDGAPKLADIGLVAATDEPQSYVGTEGYIPPEGPGGPQADLYSLGKVLYEASTGKDRTDFPDLPALWSELPEAEYRGLLELNEVILQACKHNALDRYSAAWDMHADLVVVLNGKSVKRLRILERRWRNVKRTATVAALVLVAASGVSIQVFRERRAAFDAHQRQVNFNTTRGNLAMDSGDLLRSLPYFVEAWRLDQGNRDHELIHRMRIASTLAQCPKLTQMFFAKRQVDLAQFSADGKSILIGERNGQPRICNLASGESSQQLPAQADGLLGAAFSPDGRFILTAGEWKSAVIWDAASNAKVLELRHTSTVFSGRFSHDGRRVVTACKDGIARVWNAQTGELEGTLKGHRGALLFAGFSNDDRLIATASRDETARIWSAVAPMRLIHTLPHHRWVNSAAFSPDDKYLVTAADDHKARVWEVATGARIRPDLNHNDVVKTAEFSPDGRLILTSSYDGTARLWRFDDFQPLGSNPILRHSERVTCASFSRDGRLIATCCFDGSVRVWDLAGATMPPTPRRAAFSPDTSRFLTEENGVVQVHNAEHANETGFLLHTPEPAEAAKFTADGKFVLTISSDCLNGRTNFAVQAWTSDEGRVVGQRLQVADMLTGAALAPGGQHIVTYARESAQLWDILNGTRVCAPWVHPTQVDSALFSSRGDLVATIAGTNVLVWEAATGRATFPKLEHPAPVVHAAFSGDGQYLVTCCLTPGLDKCYAYVWSARTGKRVGQPLTHDDGVLFASFSLDSQRLVTAGEDFCAKIWEAATGKELGLPLLHSEQVAGAAFSSSGKWVVTASADHTARIWDPETGDPLTPPLQHFYGLVQVRVSSDDRRLVTTDWRGNSYLWDVPIETRSLRVVAELVAFLAGRHLNPSPHSAAGLAEPLVVTWHRIRRMLPASFSTSEKDIRQWREFQAEDCEQHEQWSAAETNLRELLTLAPDDQSVAERLAKAHDRAHIAE